MSDFLYITDVKIVNEGSVFEADVLIEKGRFKAIGAVNAPEGATVINGNGQYLIPGMIDDQVHFREPGLTHKGEIKTESAAAIAGGITSYMEMPNVNPATTNAEALEDKYDRAAKKSSANFAFYLGATNDNLEDIKRLDPNAACGLKVFMGASTGNMLVDQPKVLEGIFQESPVLIVTHCEDTPMIKQLEAEYRQKFGDNIPMKYHPKIRSEAACYKSSSYAVDLAKRFNTKLHVLHITTAKELELFEAGPIDNKRITVEACVHHLYFDEKDYEQRGALIKCNPAIKTEADRKGILQAVNDGRIDAIATDHAPHTWSEKQNSYFEAPAGLPLVQDALLSLFEHYHDDVLPLTTIVEKTSHNIAKLYQVKERGYIREGYWADCVLVSFVENTPVTEERVLSKCGWSPFQGITFRSKIMTTILNGELAYHEGKVHEVRGKQLEFERG